jgi:outer membrane protein OmpA-like peptidoglycan-associated protein
MPTTLSSFGVSVFDSEGTTIRRNRIANHQASGIITSYQAKNLLVTENIIVGNGVAGMPDAIRLEGMIENSQINGNLICGNDGSGVYLFKPQGSVQIRDNQITFNGRRLRRAAVYLMGDNNQVVNNQIRYQSGPGVVVTSYPKSDRNIIEKNRFTGLEGLSIDLNTQQNVDPIDFQIGDGPNPLRNSPNRRKETANSAINAPQFNSTGETPIFFLEGDAVKLTGIADPGSTVEIYRVSESTNLPYGPLSEPITRVTSDEQGQFSVTLSGRIVKPGDKISAIATIPEYGTSEPARNAFVRKTGDTQRVIETPKSQTPAPICTTPPSPPPPPPPPPPAPSPPAPPPPQPLRLKVPRVIHFALDQATISPETAKVLDQIAAVLIANPVLTVELQGHTDPRASDAYNLELGNRRALAARNYLLRRGVAPERMTIRSFGETQRRTTGGQRIDYARDRRVELIFKDVRGIDIIFEEQETDLQLEANSRQR